MGGGVHDTNTFNIRNVILSVFTKGNFILFASMSTLSVEELRMLSHIVLIISTGSISISMLCKAWMFTNWMSNFFIAMFFHKIPHELMQVKLYIILGFLHCDSIGIICAWGMHVHAVFLLFWNGIKFCRILILQYLILRSHRFVSKHNIKLEAITFYFEFI